MNQNIMIQIIIKLIEFFLNPGLIPSQRDQMSQKLSLIFIKSMLENIKWCINVRRAICLLSKYYVINYFQSKKNMISLKQENEKYKVNFANTERQKKSSIIFMQNQLNNDAG